MRQHAADEFVASFNTGFILLGLDGAGQGLSLQVPVLMKATSTVQVQNDRVIVTEWRFAPGAETGDHVHGHDYVVVPLTSGTLKLEEPAGTRSVRLEAGASYARPAGVAHNVINDNPYEFRFVEIELI
jgi:quercetin dioxygenase-like cupin family protein